MNRRDTEDRYEARLREVIEAKLKGEGIDAGGAGEPRGDNVIDLMAALEAEPWAGCAHARRSSADAQEDGHEKGQARAGAQARLTIPFHTLRGSLAAPARRSGREGLLSRGVRR